MRKRLLVKVCILVACLIVANGFPAERYDMWAQPSEEDDVQTIARAVDTNSNMHIEDVEIIDALKLWISGEIVGQTGLEITDSLIIRLIEMWIGGERIPDGGQEDHLSDLSIRWAKVLESGPITFGQIVGRKIIMQIELSRPLNCLGSTEFMGFGFLIDSDQNPATGVTDPAFDGLGVDARISAECNANTGVFVSPTGGVSIDNLRSGSTVRIELAAEQLPSTGFYWIAYVLQGNSLIRFPEVPGYSSWTAIERALN